MNLFTPDNDYLQNRIRAKTICILWPPLLSPMGKHNSPEREKKYGTINHNRVLQCRRECSHIPSLQKHQILPANNCNWQEQDILEEYIYFITNCENYEIMKPMEEESDRTCTTFTSLTTHVNCDLTVNISTVVPRQEIYYQHCSGEIIKWIFVKMKKRNTNHLIDFQYMVSAQHQSKY